ncbi:MULTISPECIES: UxaA family hydrolase [Prauserella salsuginis group]|uniref:(2R)-sulfolactate sulfo-lyase subunit alpha n=2 Tax=Prauserella salsuginis group TaxID=2893672 RepID=A0A839XRY3_9PSEU|nr:MULTISPECIES: UxaA family hydrolase [Prauserella salsuginis group]MBB3664204.1 (2R)-sulfolactate sulfo-lyase subunit alpha [Prauserella sediminis]MCR3721653.1 (2R)-sulfolactate sulfo-lyase subunit alpha [Prauserella flava]MCR3734345.1 (2R)-sulfolactate sulfo-lyase subunit alpha [Prauserella salsuginis]
MSAPRPDFLAHRSGDAVGVAVRDLTPGPVKGGYLDSDAVEELELAHEVPLGHKVALRDIRSGDDVIEYGVRTAIASQDIARGDYVHTHNVRSARWLSSVA